MSGASGLISSLVMTLPLVAVPCLAVFGLPAIGPTTVEAETDPSVTLDLPHDHGDESPAVPATAADAASAAGAASDPADPFGPILDAAPAPRQADRSGFAPTSGRRAAGGNGSGGNGAVANGAAGLDTGSDAPAHLTPVVTASLDPFSELSGAELSGAASPGSPADWNEAMRRLAALGIRDLRLAAGETADTWHVSCAERLTADQVRRFEAEAADPLLAAEDVLAQVEQWRATR